VKDIFADSDSARVGMYKALLDEAGIGCFVRNETSSNLVGGAAVPNFYPTLCVVDDADYERAMAIVNEYSTPSGSGAGEWVCPNCKSLVPAGFDTCWNCEHERPRPAE
jgi:hypothetical protein